MTPEDTLSTTARATAACAGPNICTACVAFFIVTLLNSSVSGLAGRLGVTTANSLVKPSVLFDSVFTNACPACPDFDPMIRSMWATSFPSPTRDSPMKKSAAITTSRSGWGPRVSSAGRHECGVESSVARRGVESHAVPRLRVAPTEPYRCGANLPAAPAGVKAARGAAESPLSQAPASRHRYEERHHAHTDTPARSVRPAARHDRRPNARRPTARPAQGRGRARHRRPGDVRSADGRPGLLVRRARNAGGRDLQVFECHPRAERVRARAPGRRYPHRVGGALGERKAGDRPGIGHRLYPAGEPEAGSRVSRSDRRGRTRPWRGA